MLYSRLLSIHNHMVITLVYYPDWVQYDGKPTNWYSRSWSSLHLIIIMAIDILYYLPNKQHYHHEMLYFRSLSNPNHMVIIMFTIFIGCAQQSVKFAFDTKNKILYLENLAIHIQSRLSVHLRAVTLLNSAASSHKSFITCPAMIIGD